MVKQLQWVFIIAAAALLVGCTGPLTKTGVGNEQPGTDAPGQGGAEPPLAGGPPVIASPPVSMPPPQDPAFWFRDIYEALLDRAEGGTMGQVASCQYVCDAINARWGMSVSPAPGTGPQAANCEYLLKMIDQYVNGGVSTYGTGAFATKQVVDIGAVSSTVGRLGLMPLMYESYRTSATVPAVLRRIAYSNDLVHWVPYTFPYSGVTNGTVCYVKDRYFAWSAYASNDAFPFYYSFDGISWQEGGTFPALSYPYYWVQMDYRNGLYMLWGPQAGAGMYVAALSTDGVNWTLGSTAELPPDPARAYGNGVHVRCDALGNLLYSTDGAAWTQVPSYTGVSRVLFADGRFVAVGANGGAYRYAMSVDGIHWTLGALQAGGGGTGLVYTKGNFITMFNGTAGVRVAYSTDGVNWQYSTVTAFIPYTTWVLFQIRGT